MASASDRSWLRQTMAWGGGVVFVGSLLFFAERYARGFDAPATGNDAWPAALVDAALFTAFALHHSIFARTGFKAWLTRRLPSSLERSAYVWISSLLFILVCALWRAVPGTLWAATAGLEWTLRAVQAGGAVFTLVAARRLDVLELAGIRQALGWPLRPSTGLHDRGPYGLVRHPIYLAWLALVWAAPFMNGTRLVFAALSTLYLVIAVPLEERDLRRTFGAEYARYAARVKWRMLPGIY